MDVKIGLEIHVPLKTDRKLFCDCPTIYQKTDEPNCLICEICTAMPGIKPAPPNISAINATITISRLLDCKLSKNKIYLKRKHYDYPDLPKGYQITSEPFGTDGLFEFDQKQFSPIGIWEAHLEEDPGQFNLAKGQVDYNRSGVPLIEIVTAPDIKDAEHARAFMKELVLLLEYSGLILGGAGIIRADVNVSIDGNPRVEIKNVNSIRSIHKAIEYEISRQKKKLESGETIEQQTRGFDDETEKTYLMRKKEDAQDYRYIPDPDLPPILLNNADFQAMEDELPTTPKELRRDFVKLGVSEKYAKVLTNDCEVASFFKSVSNKVPPQLAALWICEELLAQLNYRMTKLSETKATPDNMSEVLTLIEKRKITDAVAKKLIAGVLDSDKSPKEIVESEGLYAIEDEGELLKAVKEAISQNPGPVSDYKSGKKEAINYLMGQVMRMMGGRADAREIVGLIKSELD